MAKADIARVQLKKREVPDDERASGTFSSAAAKRRQRMLGTVPEEGHCVLCTSVVDDFTAKVTCRLELYVCCRCMSERPDASEAAIALLRALRTQDRDLLSVCARATGASYEWWSQKLAQRRNKPGDDE